MILSLPPIAFSAVRAGPNPYQKGEIKESLITFEGKSSRGNAKSVVPRVVTPDVIFWPR
jgi:hypothetical protein